ncbi:MAG: Ig-like domain repeat protein [Candidatus Methylarchaceae archaeon HK02M2]|nr:Ig-like domain repeat protein [Candidatus Methylarchaceae archaeon HK02M2]
MKKWPIGLKTSLIILFLLNIAINPLSTPVLASENQVTVTEVFPDRTDVTVGEEVIFTIHVTANGTPVPGGTVTVREETDSYYNVSGTLTDGTAVLTWYAQTWTPTGWCTFLATYEGTEGYNSSVGTTQVAVESPVTPGTQETATTITPSDEIIYPDEIIGFNIEIVYLGTFFPYFDGGYIALVDITENIVLQRHDIGFEFTDTYTTTLTLTIPAWYANGTHTIESRYTGSYDADHAPSLGSCTIEVINNETSPPPEVFSIVMTGNATVIEIGTDTLQIDATIEGDDPVGKTLRLTSYQNNGSIQHLLDELTVISRDYTYLFTPGSEDQSGSILFELILEDPITEDIKATANISAILEEPITFFETIITLDTDIIEATYGTIHSIPVYLTSSNGNPITAGQLNSYVYDGVTLLLDLTAPISQGYAVVEVPIEDFGEGNYQLSLEWLGNATQNATTYDATLNVVKGTALLDSSLSSNTIEYGSVTSWNAHVTNYLGNSIANIPISFATSLTGFYWDQWGTIMTDGSGDATIEVHWTEENQVHYGQPGTYTVRITIENNDKVTTKIMTHTLNVLKNSVVLTLNDVTAAHLETAVIDGTLTTSHGISIPDATIDLYWNATATGTWQKIATVTTDDFGYYSTEIEVNLLPKSYKLKAEYKGNSYYTISAQISFLEVLDNPSEVKKIDITPTTLNLGDVVEISVNATDFDSINSVTAIIYDNYNNFTIDLEYQDGLYQKTIWCDTQYQIGIWTIDLIIIDNLGIETIFTNVGSFNIVDNPAPEVTYTVTPETIADGSSVDFEIIATDTLGIASVKIEIDHTIYDITQGDDILPESDGISTLFGGEHDARYIYNILQAREQGVFYFHYTPQTMGSIPFIIYVEDNAGKQAILNGYITVEAVAPELSIHSMSSLNGTAPHSFSLILSVIDGSGINYVSLYANDQEYSLQYNVTTNKWEISAIFNAGEYVLNIVAEDMIGTQKAVELGTLIVNQASFRITFETENLSDGETTNFTIEASDSLANATVNISWGNQDIELTLDSNATGIGQIQFYEPNTYTVEVTITDKANVQITQEYTFEITAKGPEFEEVYPDKTMLAEYHTPFTLEMETIVKDASGVSTVILHVNSTEYPLINSFGVWNTQIDLTSGTHTLKLVATDIYGSETVYILGEVILYEIITSDPGSASTFPPNPSQTPEKESSIEPTVGLIVLAVAVVTSGLFVYWRKKPKPGMTTST